MTTTFRIVGVRMGTTADLLLEMLERLDAKETRENPQVLFVLPHSNIDARMDLYAEWTGQHHELPDQRWEEKFPTAQRLLWVATASDAEVGWDEIERAGLEKFRLDAPEALQQLQKILGSIAT